MAKKKKKKHPHIDKSPIRKKKAKTWIKSYAGTDIVKDYRAHFKGVDVACAVRELQEIGYKFEQEYLKNVLRNESVRIRQIHKNKEAKQNTERYNEFQDDNFFFIAGYTSGGAPYGVQWWEMGLEPWEDINDDDGFEPQDDIEDNDNEADDDYEEADYEDYEEIADYRYYESLNKEEKDWVDNRLREDFSVYVSAYRRLPSKAQRKLMIGKVFEKCPGGEIKYYKDFNKIYHKLVKAHRSKFIREGVLPKQFTPADIKKYFGQSVMLESERLIFRKITADDFNDLAVMLRDPDVMSAWEHTFSDEQIRKWIENQRLRYKKEIVGYFAVMLKETGEFIGQMGLMWNDFDELRALEIGYMLKREHWGKGYASEGAAALAQYGFTEIGVSKVYSSIRPNNQRSIRVAERIGMSAEGSFIKQSDGKEMEHIIYSKTREPINV